MESPIPKNLCDVCKKKEVENCVLGPKEHCEDYKSELQWQFEHYESEEDRKEAAKRKAATAAEQKKNGG